MKWSTTTSVAPTLLLLVSLAEAQNSSCVSGNAVHMIVARASTEPPGTGVIGSVATRVAQQLPGSNILAVDYPATLDNYQSSESQGVTAMMKLVNDYAAACPSSRMVLMGYSQGAQVTADVVCGTDESQFNKTQVLSSSIANKVAAVVLMGDPSHAENQTFKQGTSTKDGVFPREDSSTCTTANRMVSYCNSGDTFCDSGNNITVHLSYVQNNGTSAVDFIVSKVQSGSGSGSSSGSSSGNGSSGGGGTVSTNAARNWQSQTEGPVAAFALFLAVAWFLLA